MVGGMVKVRETTCFKRLRAAATDKKSQASEQNEIAVHVLHQ
jgi:hypothetical protein